jgi:hypothetical protein
MSLIPTAHVIKPHNTQSNKTHCIVPRYSVSQYHVEHCYMFRSLMGSSSGIHTKAIVHKTEQALYSVYLLKDIKRYKKTIS